MFHYNNRTVSVSRKNTQFELRQYQIYINFNLCVNRANSSDIDHPIPIQIDQVISVYIDHP